MDITVDTVLADVGKIFTQAISWIGDILTEVASQPIALIMVVGLGLVGFAFGLCRRFIRL